MNDRKGLEFFQPTVANICGGGRSMKGLYDEWGDVAAVMYHQNKFYVNRNIYMLEIDILNGI